MQVISSRWKISYQVREVNPLDLSLNEWKQFIESPMWGAIVAEIKARDVYIMGILRGGNDKFWTDDNMRGRLDELDYIVKIPEIVIQDMELQLQQNTKLKEEE